jgi:hypothetical protein
VTLPRFRRHADEDQAATEHLQAIRPADWDGTTITFGGAAVAGLGPDAVYPEAGPATGPPARLRALPPPPAAHPAAQPAPARGYAAAATGPQPVISRMAPAIGDALTHDDEWGPKLTPLPCGHCGTFPRIPGAVLGRTRIIGYVNHLAWEAGWTYDTDLIWTCPACQAGDAWKARQGQLEVWRGDFACERHGPEHYANPDPPCTCPGAVLAVDAMLASEDYLGSGTGRHRHVLARWPQQPLERRWQAAASEVTP